MTSSNSACTSCVVVLTQQQGTAIEHQQNCSQPECNEPTASPLKNPSKLCTVVENGKVVVRPVRLED